MQTEQVTRRYRVLLSAALIAIFFLATTSKAIPVMKDINDKINHAFAFYTLALLVDFSWPKTPFRAPKFCPLLAYGLVIEVVQYFLAYRTFSVLDLGADAVGLFFYWFTVPLLLRIAPLSRRWKD